MAPAALTRSTLAGKGTKIHFVYQSELRYPRAMGSSHPFPAVLPYFFSFGLTSIGLIAFNCNLLPRCRYIYGTFVLIIRSLASEAS